MIGTSPRRFFPHSLFAIQNVIKSDSNLFGFACICDKSRVAPVRLGYGLGWNGSTGSGFRFRRFLCQKGLSVFQYIFKGKDGSGFGSWKMVPAVPVPLSVSGKTVPTVPVSGSGSVPEPPCKSKGDFNVNITHSDNGLSLLASHLLLVFWVWCCVGAQKLTCGSV